MDGQPVGLDVGNFLPLAVAAGVDSSIAAELIAAVDLGAAEGFGRRRAEEDPET